MECRGSNRCMASLRLSLLATSTPAGAGTSDGPRSISAMLMAPPMTMPAITASTSGSGGASAILLGDLRFELGGRMAGVSQAPASPGGFSVNHCTMPGMSGSNGPGTETLSTPARASPRFSKSWVTPPGTRTNDPLGA